MLLLGTIFTRQVWCTTVFTVCRILSKKTTVVHHDEETHQPTIEVYGAEAAHTVLVNRIHSLLVLVFSYNFLTIRKIQNNQLRLRTKTCIGAPELVQQAAAHQTPWCLLAQHVAQGLITSGSCSTKPCQAPLIHTTTISSSLLVIIRNLQTIFLLHRRPLPSPGLCLV